MYPNINQFKFNPLFIEINFFQCKQAIVLKNNVYDLNKTKLMYVWFHSQRDHN